MFWVLVIYSNLMALPRQYQSIRRPSVTADPADSPAQSGSLWSSSGMTNYYFTHTKSKKPGEMIALQLTDEVYQNILKYTFNSLRDNEQKKCLDNYKKILRSQVQMPAEGSEEKKNTSPILRNIELNQKLLAAKTIGEKEKIIQQVSLQDIDLSLLVDVKSNEILAADITQRIDNDLIIILTKQINILGLKTKLISLNIRIPVSEIIDQKEPVSCALFKEKYTIHVSGG